MEFIRGGRVDDLEYLAAHGIDRNKVSVELARIFAQMVHLNGWFHAVRLELPPFLLANVLNLGPTSRYFLHYIYASSGG